MDLNKNEIISRNHIPSFQYSGTKRAEAHLVCNTEDEFRGKQGAAYKYHPNLKVRRILSLKGELERAMKGNCYLMAKQKPSGTTLNSFSLPIVGNRAFLDYYIYRDERKHLIVGCRESCITNHKSLPRFGSQFYIETLVFVIVSMVRGFYLKQCLLINALLWQVLRLD